ncbi:MAG: type I DNA topoisomerase, partial [Pseudomonadota bacterium]|nr:type I DNA topoisomerase [Pseudomonadota bacterium]
KTVVIVESPAKAKTIAGYLGKGYTVLSSKGHVRDLEPKKGAVDPDNGFKMKYKAIPDSANYVKKIIDSTRNAENLLLATDPDREGEAIAWHLCELIGEKKLKNLKIARVVFHQITKKAIKEAIDSPRIINQDLVDAQQARRALDYLIGFYASPLLWKKIRRGLSAGRVQSPALCLIVNREQEIKAFEPQEYWTITALLQEEKQQFPAKLYEYEGEKIKQFSITNKEQAEKVHKNLQDNSNNILEVVDIETKPRKRNPAAPFITSTLQQEAARKIGFSSSKTMMVAQQLYEGISTKEGTIGLITYMRTDSVSLAGEAIAEIRDYIEKNYGSEMMPTKPHQYKTKAKNAQEAHEAIRPTSIFRKPKDLATNLSPDQLKLYDLIWKRTLACQMKHATLLATRIDMDCGKKGIFRATGSTVSEPGFLSVYEEGSDDKKDSKKEIKLPKVVLGQKIPLEKINSEQHFTEPPPRYSEASLVKTLEEYGIGRPSTYASIIQTLKNREYVTLEQKRFHPTDTGEIVCGFLSKYLNQYVDYGFTAELEDQLDAISRGELKWIPLLEKFWDPFKEKVDHIDNEVQRKDVTHEKLDEKCPECGGELSVRLGKRGKFIGCNNYPDCKYTRGMEDDKTESSTPEVISDRKCPKCESDLVIKPGRYGKFIGCSNYPNCKHMEPLEKPESTGVSCAKCEPGVLLKRKSRRGTFFYSCDQYPKCKYAVWNEPLKKSCPKCNWPILTLKETKKFGKEIVCPECGHKEPAE